MKKLNLMRKGKLRFRRNEANGSFLKDSLKNTF